MIATEKDLRFTDMLNTDVLLRPSEKSSLAVEWFRRKKRQGMEQASTGSSFLVFFVCLSVCGVGNMTLTIVMWWSLVIFCECALKVGVVSVVCVV